LGLVQIYNSLGGGWEQEGGPPSGRAGAGH